ncbi:hypothetical protein F5B21DRAFT_455332, partial [Xylaria acuta]
MKKGYLILFSVLSIYMYVPFPSKYTIVTSGPSITLSCPRKSFVLSETSVCLTDILLHYLLFDMLVLLFHIS